MHPNNWHEWVMISSWLVLIPTLLGIIAVGLAKLNLFFTLVDEGTAKAIIKNGRFLRLMMSYKGHRFARRHIRSVETAEVWTSDRSSHEHLDFTVGAPPRRVVIKKADGTDDVPRYMMIDEWDVLPCLEGEDANSSLWNKIPLVGGIRWVGIPPFYSVYKHRFRWFSNEAKVDEKGDPVMSLTVEEKVIDYILLMSDVYAIKLPPILTKDLVPVTVILLLTIEVRNPWKAMFKVEQWLEQVQNQVYPVVRAYIGSMLLDDLTGDQRASADAIRDAVRSTIHRIFIEYGVYITLIEIGAMEPEGRAQQMQIIFEAEQSAKKTLLSAEADAKAIEIRTKADSARAIKLREAYGESQIGASVLASETLQKLPVGTTLVVGTGNVLSTAFLAGNVKKPVVGEGGGS